MIELADQIRVGVVGGGTGSRPDGFATPWRFLPTVLLEFASARGSWEVELPRMRPLVCTPGRVLMVPPGMHHRLVMRCPRPVVSRWVLLDVRHASGVDLIPPYARPQVLGPTTSSRVRSCIQSLVSTDPLQTPGREPASLLATVRQQRASLELVETLLLAGLFAALDPMPRVERLLPALQMVESKMHTSVSRDDLASAVGLSPARLHTLFVQAMGISPAAYVQRQRVRSAQRLLLATDLPISEVGLRCGFSSAAYFSRAFLRTAKTTPTLYRHHHRALFGKRIDSRS